LLKLSIKDILITQFFPASNLFKSQVSTFFYFWSNRPDKRLWILFPLGYTFFLQILTGFPKPNSLKALDANELFVRFSEELFGYPFWLQDLSHLPLFYVLAWLWSWYFGPAYTFTSALKNKAFYIATLYGITNELAQAFIPERFPSAGDLIMNLAGVFLGLSTHSILCRKLGKSKMESV